MIIKLWDIIIRLSENQTPILTFCNVLFYNYLIAEIYICLVSAWAISGRSLSKIEYQPYSLPSTTFQPSSVYLIEKLGQSSISVNLEIEAIYILKSFYLFGKSTVPSRAVGTAASRLIAPSLVPTSWFPIKSVHLLPHSSLSFFIVQLYPHLHPPSLSYFSRSR